MELFPPADLLAAYRMGRQKYGTGDLVLVVAKHDAELIETWPRHEYIKSALRRCPPKQLANIRLAHESAHAIVKLPADSEAFWLVLEVRELPIPIMTVLYSVPYDLTAVAN